MSVQALIVTAIIVAAGVYAAITLVRRGRSFSTNKDCGNDECNCGHG